MHFVSNSKINQIPFLKTANIIMHGKVMTVLKEAK